MQNKVVLIQNAIKKFEEQEGRKADKEVVSFVYALFSPKMSSTDREKIITSLQGGIA